VPEIAVFFDINPVYKGKLTENKDFCDMIEKLKEKGFENNIKGAVKNQWRLLYKRKPFNELVSLSEIDDVQIGEELKTFFETALKEICEAGLDKHSYFEELLLRVDADK
jgi:hypothetical protein